MSVIVLSTSYFIFGIGSVPRIKSLSRDTKNDAWKINATHANGHYQNIFRDSTYGGSARAYRRAMATIRRLSPIERPYSPDILKEKSTKQVKLDCPGVMLRTTSNRKGVLQYSFHVCNPANGKIEEVYIGDETTCMDNWDDALQLAKAYRSNFTFRNRLARRLNV